EQLWSICWREVCARADPGSVIFLQVHAVIQAGDLIAVTIKHERGALEDFTEAAFLGLGPVRVVDVWIHVRIEAVLAWRREVPSRGRHLLLESNFDQRLYAFETVLPREHHANGCAVLIRKRFAIHSDTEKSERVHGFVHAQAFDIGKVDARVFCLRHLPVIEIALEGDELRFWRGLNKVDKIAKGKSNPGNDNRPGLDAAVAIDAFLERGDFQDFVHRELAGLFYF